MKEQTLQIVLFPLAVVSVGFWIFACAAHLFILPLIACWELSDREGHRRRKELWARLKENQQEERGGVK